MPKRGGGPLERIGVDAVSAGLWGLAYRNSDGSFLNTYFLRTYYGVVLFLILFIFPMCILLLIAHFASKPSSENTGKVVPHTK